MARYRITGVSPWGLQWERKDDDKEIARRLINLMEDRRILWQDFDLEIEHHCASSADRVRHDLTALLNNPEIGPELGGRIKAIRQAFREFLDEIGPTGSRHHRHHGYGAAPLPVALGRLRGLVGVQLGEIAGHWDVEVNDDLATIIPDGTGWFFERFE